MRATAECVIDTTILQKANAPLLRPPRKGAFFHKRVNLLRRIQDGRQRALISRQLLAEYERRIPAPRNDFVGAFLAMIVVPGRCVWNWEKSWSGGKRDQARRCRYPSEDDHVLRTAIRSHPTTIYTEEERMLRADACIYRVFRVHIRLPS